MPRSILSDVRRQVRLSMSYRSSTTRLNCVIPHPLSPAPESYLLAPISTHPMPTRLFILSKTSGLLFCRYCPLLVSALWGVECRQRFRLLQATVSRLLGLSRTSTPCWPNAGLLLLPCVMARG